MASVTSNCACARPAWRTFLLSVALVVLGLHSSSVTDAASTGGSQVKKMSSVLHPAFANAGKKEGLQIWRIENFVPVAYPQKDFGKFYSGDSFIVLKTVEDKKGTFKWDIHFWLGSKTSQDESGAAAILSVELDDGLGGGPVQHRETEGHESQQFISYFPSGVRYLPGGVNSGFNHVTTNALGEKRLYQVKGKRNVRVRQVELNIKSMNKGDCFILDTGSEIYVYVGPNSKGSEKVKATAAANMIRDQDHAGRGHVTIVDSSSTETEVQQFFSELGSGNASQISDETKGGDDQEFETKQDATVTLYKVSDAGGKLVSEKISQKPLSQNMLVTDDCFILDTVTSGIYVWIGKKGTVQEKVEALKKAQLFLTENNYPSWTKLTRVVEGAEPAAFREYFSTWQQRSPSPTRRNSPDINLSAENTTTNSRRSGRSSLSSRLANVVECGGGIADEKYILPSPLLSATSAISLEPAGVQVFRIEDAALDPLAVDSNFYFFSGDCYIVKYAYPYHHTRNYLLYVWQGSDSTVKLRRAASLSAAIIDRKLHGRATQIRVLQGHEPSYLRRLLKGHMIVYRGHRAHNFHRPEPFHTGARLFQIRSSCLGDGQAIEVAALASSLNSEDAFILDTPATSYLWYGQGCSAIERAEARNFYELVTLEKRKIVILEEGSEFPEFWDLLRGRLAYPHSYVHHKTVVVPLRLYHCVLVDHSLRLDAIEHFDQNELLDDDVSIIDTGDNVYVWVGSHSTEEEKELAVERAQEILDEYSGGRSEQAVVIAVRRGYEPPGLLSYFPTWKEQYWPPTDITTNPDEELNDEINEIVNYVKLGLSNRLDSIGEGDANEPIQVHSNNEPNEKKEEEHEGGTVTLGEESVWTSNINKPNEKESYDPTHFKTMTEPNRETKNYDNYTSFIENFGVDDTNNNDFKNDTHKNNGEKYYSGVNNYTDITEDFDLLDVDYSQKNDNNNNNNNYFDYDLPNNTFKNTFYK